MTEKEFLNYLTRNYKQAKKENIFEWAEEALEFMDVKVGMKDITIIRLEEHLKALAEALVTAFRENRKVYIEDFNKAVDVLDSLKEE